MAVEIIRYRLEPGTNEFRDYLSEGSDYSRDTDLHLTSFKLPIKLANKHLCMGDQIIKKHVVLENLHGEIMLNLSFALLCKAHAYEKIRGKYYVTDALLDISSILCNSKNDIEVTYPTNVPVLPLVKINIENACVLSIITERLNIPGFPIPFNIFTYIVHDCTQGNLGRICFSSSIYRVD